MNRRIFSRALAVVILCFVRSARIYPNQKSDRAGAWLFGFDSVLGVYDYWYGIGNELKAGGAKVYTASLSASNFTEVRGEQLVRDLDTLRAVTGKQKFNLIGHSHGGPTVRYVASVRSDLVASVTVLGSPNTGAPAADAITATLPPSSPLRPARGLVRQCAQQRLSGRPVGQQ